MESGLPLGGRGRIGENLFMVLAARPKLISKRVKLSLFAILGKEIIEHGDTLPYRVCARHSRRREVGS